MALVRPTFRRAREDTAREGPPADARGGGPQGGRGAAAPRPGVAAPPGGPQAPVERARQREQMRVLVLITGTGRSGTSTMSGTLHHLGLDVPGPYLGANESNPKGFFENKWSVKFHKALVERAGIHEFDSRPSALERAQAAITDDTRAELAGWCATMRTGSPSSSSRTRDRSSPRRCGVTPRPSPGWRSGTSRCSDTRPRWWQPGHELRLLRGEEAARVRDLQRGPLDQQLAHQRAGDAWPAPRVRALQRPARGLARRSAADRRGARPHVRLRPHLGARLAPGRRVHRPQPAASPGDLGRARASPGSSRTSPRRSGTG